MTNAVIVHADCLVALRQLDDNSIDAVVTDPPAGIAFMGKAWDRMERDGMTELQAFQEFIREVFVEVYRVLKPGGHAVVWALPRTSHHTAMGLERAGFDIRDNGTYFFHVFGGGFPKSLDVSKAIDKAAGAERENDYKTTTVRETPNSSSHRGTHVCNNCGKYFGSAAANCHCPRSVPVTDAAKAWEGWGTALKPAVEFWIVARKPLDGTVAANVLEHGTGALNIDGCRVQHAGAADLSASLARNPGRTEGVTSAVYGNNRPQQSVNREGRWPAHLILDEGAAALLDAQSGVMKSGVSVQRNGGGQKFGTTTYSGSKNILFRPDVGYGDVGGASRFFYVPKAAKRDKDEGLDEFTEKSPGEKTERQEGSVGISPYAGSRGPSKNSHPTVKSTALMSWLVRLVTPPGGVVLDPFMGSGSTGKAALLEGFSFLGIEREAEYIEIARRRLEHAGNAPVEVVQLEES